MKNIYLLGMMNCGKSTCARLLQTALSLPALDTDQTIEAEAAMPIRDIFAKYGEAHFRDLETDLCRDLATRENLIVACGGGLPLREENRRLLRQSGRVIFLNRDPGRSYDQADMSSRPLGQQGREAFLARFSQREPLYRAAAHFIIGDYPTPEDTVAEILRQLEVQP